MTAIPIRTARMGAKIALTVIVITIEETEMILARSGIALWILQSRIKDPKYLLFMSQL